MDGGFEAGASSGDVVADLRAASAASREPMAGDFYRASLPWRAQMFRRSLPEASSMADGSHASAARPHVAADPLESGRSSRIDDVPCLGEVLVEKASQSLAGIGEERVHRAFA
jgi:hypothetical protein